MDWSAWTAVVLNCVNLDSTLFHRTHNKQCDFFFPRRLLWGECLPQWGNMCDGSRGRSIYLHLCRWLRWRHLQPDRDGYVTEDAFFFLTCSLSIILAVYLLLPCWCFLRALQPKPLQERRIVWGGDTDPTGGCFQRVHLQVPARLRGRALPDQ